MARSVWLCLLCSVAVSSVGCGGGGSSSSSQQLRFVMASPATPTVDVLINGSQVATSLAYTNFTSYLPVTTKQQKVRVQTVSNSSTVFQQSIVVPAGADQTLILTGANGESLLLTDGGTTTTTGFGNVRVVNASSTMGAADVYIVNAGAGLGGAKPTSPKLPFDQTTGYLSEAIGNYEVFVTAPGTTNVDLDTGSLALTQSQYQTVIVVDGVSGGLNYILLTDQ